jgi:hypothetical protein
MNCYFAIKDIPRARAADFVDLAKSNEVCFIDMLQNLSQDIDWDRRHECDSYGLCPPEIAGVLIYQNDPIVVHRMRRTCQAVPNLGSESNMRKVMIDRPYIHLTTNIYRTPSNAFYIIALIPFYSSGSSESTQLSMFIRSRSAIPSTIRQ